MTIVEAVLKVERIYVRGWQTQLRELQADPTAARQALKQADQSGRLREFMDGLSTHRSGKVTVSRLFDRSIGQCPHCGEQFNAGTYVVRHDDGQVVRFDLGLVHYAKKHHPISEENVDIPTLLAIMQDA